MRGHGGGGRGAAGIATGAALTAKTLGTGDVAVCFFGDGALGQGLLYECMNMAALWDLPVIYACENNLYGEYTHVSEMAAGALMDRIGKSLVPFIPTFTCLVKAR